MRVIRSEVLGMCFGVRDALKAMDRVEEPESVTIHGELVHNEVVLRDLAARGFKTVSESDRDAMPETPGVLITAHGVSDRERDRLDAAGKRLIDTTCPLVRRAHEAALDAPGRGPSRPGHRQARARRGPGARRGPAELRHHRVRVRRRDIRPPQARRDLPDDQHRPRWSIASAA